MAHVSPWNALLSIRVTLIVPLLHRVAPLFGNVRSITRPHSTDPPKPPDQRCGPVRPALHVLYAGGSALPVTRRSDDA